MGTEGMAVPGFSNKGWGCGSFFLLQVEKSCEQLGGGVSPHFLGGKVLTPLTPQWLRPCICYKLIIFLCSFHTKIDKLMNNLAWLAVLVG